VVREERTVKSTAVLIVDAVINLALGILLLLSTRFPEPLTQFLGVPPIERPFYPSLFGGVLVGIGFALLIGSLRSKQQEPVGLGLGGAVAINFSGGVVLAAWLIFGRLSIPLRGRVFLWGLEALLVLVSAVELAAHMRGRRTARWEGDR
jgi:hypothetical protein